jgi:YesN/AraC family two-component response regulator
MNILVVEDEPLALDDLLGMLQVFGGAHRITGCASGVEALAYAEKIPPDLIITDIRMPEIDGLDLVRQLKARTPQLAAIVLSGYSEFEYARTSLRLGIADYLLKPVRTDALHQAVTRALEAITAERTHATRLREAELARLLLGGQRATSTEPNLLAGDWGVVILICENWEGPAIWRDTPIDRAFIARVHADYAEDISLQAFATEHNVSLAYFSRLFKDEVGMTFSDYLTRMRIEKAKELLERQDLRLSDISGLVGYDDPKYFGQIFRKVAGISALDYQRSRQRNGQRIDSIADEQKGS